MNFEEARAEYSRLRQQLDYRQLAPEEFARRVQSLQVVDPHGVYWSIDGASGGWLRYDGARWLPDTPAVPSAYAPASPWYPGAAPVPGRSPDHYPVARATPGGGPSRVLLTVLTALATLVLGILLLGSVALASGKLTFDTSSGLIDPVVATGIGPDSRPVASARDFPLGADVYITFTARRLRTGETVTVRALRDGQPVPVEPSSNVIVARQDATYYGAVAYRPALPGNYQVGLFLGNATVPSQTLTFTVR